MKRTIKTILCAAAAVLAAVSCQKSVEPVQTAEEGKGTIDVRVNGLMGEYNQQDGVKSSLVNNVRVAWAAGDLVYVFDGTNYLGKLTAALDKKADGETDEDRYAKLSGTINVPTTTPCTLTLVHSSLMTAPEDGAEVSELSIDMSTQSTDKVPFVAYATMDYTGIAVSDAVVPFQFATSVIKVNCTGLKANTAITSATLTNVNTACKLTLSGSKAPTVSGDVNGTITRTGDAYFAESKVNDEGEAVFQIAVPILETASGARVLTVAQGSDKVKDKKFTTNSLVAATSVNTVCQLVGLPAGALPGVFSVSTTKKVHFSKGNLWYDKKEGESESSLHFEDAQWKSTPASDDSKDASHISHFTWSDNVASAVGDNSSGTNLFCDENHKQSVDGSEDIYYALSKDEWTYLFDNHNKKWITVCGQTGYAIAPDGVSADAIAGSYTTDTDWKTAQDAGIVFLPAAGSRGGSDVNEVGVIGYYWSSAANGNSLAWSVLFESSGVATVGCGRNFGCSVRLITESN